MKLTSRAPRSRLPSKLARRHHAARSDVDRFRAVAGGNEIAYLGGQLAEAEGAVGVAHQQYRLRPRLATRRVFVRHDLPDLGLRFGQSARRQPSDADIGGAVVVDKPRVRSRL